MLEVILPWFDSKLYPNQNTPKRILAPIIKAYRWKSYQLSKKHRNKIPEGNIKLSIMFCAPNAKPDLDGCLSAIKSGLDGVADGLGVNDKRFRPITMDFAAPDKNHPRVQIFIEEAYKNG